ncbi:MAG: hypothetical protein JWM25_1086 [Thermoleophilia bacterium]|nr:hypothetical protein [Thermoleophilia bacterium]
MAASSDTHAQELRGYSDDKVALLRRLRRIEGQVRGISRMVEEDRYCLDILTQLSAVRAAVDKVALGVVGEHVNHCVVHAPADAREARAEELVAALGRFVGSR